METFFKFLLIIHIVGGTTGLITGIINMIGKKGGKKHKRIGKFFTYSMLSTGISSLFMALLHANLFLFMVGVFTVYMVATGNRYLRFKTNLNNQRTSLIDIILIVLMFISGAIFLSLGIYNLISQNYFGLVFVTFGYLGLQYVYNDIKNFRGKSRSINFWLLEHIQRMTGAFIAALTAFLVVNYKYFPEFIPSFVLWLLPTFIITPLIFSWTKKYEIRRNQTK